MFEIYFVVCYLGETFQRFSFSTDHARKRGRLSGSTLLAADLLLLLVITRGRPCYEGASVVDHCGVGMNMALTVECDF